MALGNLKLSFLYPMGLSQLHFQQVVESQDPLHWDSARNNGHDALKARFQSALKVSLGQGKSLARPIFAVRQIVKIQENF